MPGLSGYLNSPDDDILDLAAEAEEEQRQRLLAAGPPGNRPKWWEPPVDIPAPRPIEDAVAPEAVEPPPDLPSVATAPTPSAPPGVAPVDANVQSANQRLQQVFRNKPQPTKPKWYQLLGAGATGALAGYANATGRSRPIDPSGAADAILGGPGNRRRLGDWQHQVQEAQLGVQGAQGEREAWFKKNKEEADQELQRAQAEHLRGQAAADKARAEREQNQWKFDAKSGRLYNTITGETKEPASTLAGRIKEARSAGLSGEEAKIYATGGKLGEAKPETWQNQKEVDAAGNTWEWRVNPHTGESTQPVNKGKIGKPQVQPDQGARDTARGDRSYQFNVGELGKVAKPVEDALPRMSRLQETLAQNTPQADALVAPELLTVMAGGAGSGLRMNEAEIARIVGGRTNWEGIKASLGAWQANPTKGFAITPEQRRQIGQLVNAVNEKLLIKQKVVTEAHRGLIGTEDPAEHRRIVTEARERLSQVDQGSATPKVKPIIQHSKSTGLDRYSIDGGKTWLPGLPPQQ